MIAQDVDLVLGLLAHAQQAGNARWRSGNRALRHVISGDAGGSLFDTADILAVDETYVVSVWVYAEDAVDEQKLWVAPNWASAKRPL